MTDERTALLEGLAGAETFRACEQCGCCSSACPITGDDFNIRRIIRHIELGLVDTIARTAQAWACTTCARCESACPNGIAILDLVRPLRAAAPADLVPAGPPPCVLACPAGVDVPGYLRLIAQGRPDEAHSLVLSSVPFPGILGRVCGRPCEARCRRGEVNEPVAICALKRYAADNRGSSSLADVAVAPDTGHKVAVIGAGPAGLTAALCLRRKGHRVTVFEARPKPGGMMRYGIPRYRLPEDVLDEEIGRVLGLGIELVTNSRLGVDFDLAQLVADGFGATFVALGLQDSRRIDLEGAGPEQVSWGIEFLRAAGEGLQPAVADRVLVVGGGSVALDAALSARRLGAKEVTVACLESRAEMPAHPWEVETALEEGIVLMPGWGPERVIGRSGAIEALQLVECESVFDDEGNFRPAFGDARETVATDQVILAIGQRADLVGVDGAAGVGVAKGLVVVDAETQRTAADGVFAGGDVASGPGSIIGAIADGKRAAAAIDRFLGGDGAVGLAAAEALARDYDGRRDRGFADLGRPAARTVPVPDRLGTSLEFELGLTDDEARAEAGRCLQCDLELRLVDEILDQGPSA